MVATYCRIRTVGNVENGGGKCKRRNGIGQSDRQLLKNECMQPSRNHTFLSLACIGSCLHVGKNLVVEKEDDDRQLSWPCLRRAT
jgi:hypothetical protein